MHLVQRKVWNFNIGFFTQPITANIGYRYGYVFASCNLLGAAVVYFLFVLLTSSFTSHFVLMHIESAFTNLVASHSKLSIQCTTIRMSNRGPPPNTSLRVTLLVKERETPKTTRMMRIPLSVTVHQGLHRKRKTKKRTTALRIATRLASRIPIIQLFDSHSEYCLKESRSKEKILQCKK